MPPEILALIDKPLSLIAVLFVGGLAGMLVEQIVSKQRRAAWKRRNVGRWRSDRGRVVAGREPQRAQPAADTAAPADTDAADQLRRVMAAEFSARSLLNKGEAKLFNALDQAVIARNPGWQVMAQVSLGEFLATPDKQAYGCINSKRVDFALMDPDARVRHALEYQGSGHHLPGGGAAARDAVKKEALRKAGIGYHEVVAGHTTPANLRALVEKLVPLEAGERAA